MCYVLDGFRHIEHFLSCLLQQLCFWFIIEILEGKHFSIRYRLSFTQSSGVGNGFLDTREAGFSPQDFELLWGSYFAINSVHHPQLRKLSALPWRRGLLLFPLPSRTYTSKLTGEGQACFFPHPSLQPHSPCPPPLPWFGSVSLCHQPSSLTFSSAGTSGIQAFQVEGCQVKPTLFSGKLTTTRPWQAPYHVREQCMADFYFSPS